MLTFFSPANRYLRKIKLLLPFHGKSEKQYIKHISNSINYYLSDHSEISYADLTKQFGTPKSLICDYYKTIAPNNLVKRMYMKKILRTAAWTFICGILIITLIRSAQINKEYQNYLDNISTYEQTIITTH